jgi:hypothetical protein
VTYNTNSTNLWYTFINHTEPLKQEAHEWENRMTTTGSIVLCTLCIECMWKAIVYYRLCRDGIYFDKILVSEYKPFKRSNKANLFLALVQQPVSQIKMTFQEIRIIASGPCKTNQLRDLNTICRRSWYIAAHIWKIYDFKIKVVPFIIHFSTELTTVVKFEI